jgi:hypothetical protein
MMFLSTISSVAATLARAIDVSTNWQVMILDCLTLQNTRSVFTDVLGYNDEPGIFFHFCELTKFGQALCSELKVSKLHPSRA